MKISVIVWAEFLCGPVSDDAIAIIESLVSEPVALLSEDARRGAELFNVTGRRRGSLADCLIAATCIRLHAALATNNISDFARFQPIGLRLAAA